MSNTDPLVKFLSISLIKQRRDRYLTLIRNSRGQKTFLKSLDHDIENAVDRTLLVEKLPTAVWKEACLYYSSSGGYGIEFETVKAAYDEAPWEGGWLLLSKSGKSGVIRPEGRIDDEMLITP